MKTMKKVLAVVLALTMVFAFGSLAVSAKEITSGQIYCGPEGTVYANPGEIVKAPIQFVADAFESDGYPTDGTLHIPFMVFTGDAELAPLTGIELTEEAKAAIEDGTYDATVAMSPYLMGREAVIMMLKALEGQEVTSIGDSTPMALVNADNVAEMSDWH